MFMHAGWEHILGNMLFLWVFGPGIEVPVGSMRYTAFYLLGGSRPPLPRSRSTRVPPFPTWAPAGRSQRSWESFLITYPRDKIKTVLLLGWFVSIRYIPAVLLVGLWFLTQLFSQVGALVQVDTSGVAYMAHVGGFLFGMIAGRLFELPARVEEQRWNE